MKFEVCHFRLAATWSQQNQIRVCNYFRFHCQKDMEYWQLFFSLHSMSFSIFISKTMRILFFFPLHYFVASKKFSYHYLRGLRSAVNEKGPNSFISQKMKIGKFHAQTKAEGNFLSFVSNNNEIWVEIFRFSHTKKNNMIMMGIKKKIFDVSLKSFCACNTSLTSKKMKIFEISLALAQHTKFFI